MGKRDIKQAETLANTRIERALAGYKNKTTILCNNRYKPYIITRINRNNGRRNKIG